MNRALPFVLLIAVILFLCYCTKEETLEVQKTEPEKIWSLKGETLELEIVQTQKLRTKGLMFHEPLKGNEGMLFVYKNAQRLSFWNPNVSFDIDLAYIDDQAKIISIHHLKALNERSVVSKRKAAYVLEMRANWFTEKNILVGESWSQLLERKWEDVE